jgi:uncharacterized small protein (DUF1192 family)
MDEPAPPRPKRGESLIEATKEDLDLYAVEELRERIEVLQGEIARAQAQIARKTAGRSAADALFSFKRE